VAAAKVIAKNAFPIDLALFDIDVRRRLSSQFFVGGYDFKYCSELRWQLGLVK
jgi:hypothetical protein